MKITRYNFITFILVFLSLFLALKISADTSTTELSNLTIFPDMSDPLQVIFNNDSNYSQPRDIGFFSHPLDDANVNFNGQNDQVTYDMGDGVLKNFDVDDYFITNGMKYVMNEGFDGNTTSAGQICELLRTCISTYENHKTTCKANYNVCIAQCAPNDALCVTDCSALWNSCKILSQNQYSECAEDFVTGFFDLPVGGIQFLRQEMNAIGKSLYLFSDTAAEDEAVIRSFATLLYPLAWCYFPISSTELTLPDVRFDSASSENVNTGKWLAPYAMGYPLLYDDDISTGLAINSDRYGSVSGIVTLLPYAETPSIGTGDSVDSSGSWLGGEYTQIGKAGVKYSLGYYTYNAERKNFELTDLVPSHFSSQKLVCKDTSKSPAELKIAGCVSENQPVAFTNPKLQADVHKIDTYDDIIIANRGTLPGDSRKGYFTVYLGNAENVGQAYTPFSYVAYNFLIGEEPYDMAVADSKYALVTTDKGVEKISYGYTNTGILSASSEMLYSIAPNETMRPYQITSVDKRSIERHCDGYAFTWGRMNDDDPSDYEFSDKFTLCITEDCANYICKDISVPPMSDSASPMITGIAFSKAQKEKGLNAGIWVTDNRVYGTTEEPLAYAYFFPFTYDGLDEFPINLIDPVKQAYRVSKEMGYLDGNFQGGGALKVRIDRFGNIGVVLGYPTVWTNPEPACSPTGRKIIFPASIDNKGVQNIKLIPQSCKTNMLQSGNSNCAIDDLNCDGMADPADNQCILEWNGQGCTFQIPSTTDICYQIIEDCCGTYPPQEECREFASPTIQFSALPKYKVDEKTAATGMIDSVKIGSSTVYSKLKGLFGQPESTNTAISKKVFSLENMQQQIIGLAMTEGLNANIVGIDKDILDKFVPDFGGTLGGETGGTEEESGDTDTPTYTKPPAKGTVTVLINKSLLKEDTSCPSICLDASTNPTTDQYLAYVATWPDECKGKVVFNELGVPVECEACPAFSCAGQTADKYSNWTATCKEKSADWTDLNTNGVPDICECNNTCLATGSTAADYKNGFSKECLDIWLDGKDINEDLIPDPCQVEPQCPICEPDQANGQYSQLCWDANGGGGGEKPEGCLEPPENPTPPVPALGDCYQDVGRNGHSAVGIGPEDNSENNFSKYVVGLNDKVNNIICSAIKAKGGTCTPSHFDVFVGEGGYFDIKCALQGGTASASASKASEWSVWKFGGAPLEVDNYGRENRRNSVPDETTVIVSGGKNVTVSRDDLLKNSATRVAAASASSSGQQKEILSSNSVLTYTPDLVQNAKLQIVVPEENVFVETSDDTVLLDLGNTADDPLVSLSVKSAAASTSVSQLLPEILISPDASKYVSSESTVFELQGTSPYDFASWGQKIILLQSRGFDPNVVIDCIKNAANQVISDSAKSGTFKTIMDTANSNGCLNWDNTGWMSQKYLFSVTDSQVPAYLFNVPLAATPTSGASGGCSCTECVRK